MNNHKIDITMKRVLNSGCLLLILALFAVGCGKDPKIENEIFGGGEGMGRFALSLGTMGNFEVVSSKAADVAVGDFTVRITGKTLKETTYDSIWVRYAEMPPIVTIPAGTYKIEAYNGEQRSGFDSPYYYGSKNFTVGIQELIDAQVICQLACVKVSVEFTSLFLNNVNNAVCIVSSPLGGAALEFDPEDVDKTGYLAAPADSILEVNVRGNYVEDGQTVDRTYKIKSVGAKQWHKIALSVNTSAGIENGGNMIQVDHSVDEKESTVLVPGSNDLIDNNGDQGSWDDEEKPDPEEPVDPKPETTLSMTGVDYNGSTFNVDEPIVVLGSTDDLKDNPVTLNVELKASKGGIQHLYLRMESTESMTQTVFGSMGQMDLANPEGDENAMMVVGIMQMDTNPVKGKTSYMFSIGAFMALLPPPNPGEREYHEHTFYITIEDGDGNSLSKTLLIKRKEA